MFPTYVLKSLALIVLVAISVACSEQKPEASNASNASKSMVEDADGLLIKFDAEYAGDWELRRGVLEVGGLREVSSLGSLAPRWFRVVQKDATGSLQQAYDTIRTSVGIEKAEPNYLVYAHNTLPDDEYFAKQVSLHNMGQGTGLDGVDIDAPEAWDIQSGVPVIVAVLDSGIDMGHPDLEQNIWLNKSEIAGNGIDDDQNGFVDDISGWDFVAGNGNIKDDNGHGTHVAGIIGAVGNNKLGIAGINWRARLMPLKLLDTNGVGSIYSAVRALSYAVDNGASVSNMSWGTNEFSSALHEAIQQAGTLGHLVVASAGNDSANVDDIPAYSAVYDLNNMILVAAANERAQLASFSNYSISGKVHVAAPGVNIFSTFSRDVSQTDSPSGFAVLSGSSMAAAHVSGVVSLILGQAERPDPWQIKQAIFNGASTNSVFNEKVAAGGMLNAYGVLSQFIDGAVSNEVETDDSKDDVSIDQATDEKTPETVEEVEPEENLATEVVVNEIVLQPSTLEIAIGDTFEFFATGGNGELVWELSDPTIGYVDGSGMFNASALGEVQLLARDANGVESNIATIVVTELSIQSANLSNLIVGDSVPLQVTGGVGPFDWSITGSSSSASLTVNSDDSRNATVVAVQPGSFQIEVADTASTSVLSYITKSIDVTATQVAINIPSSTSLLIGETVQLTSTSTSDTITWMSSDPQIASIDESTGLVVANAKGSVTITATDEYAQSDSFALNVNVLPIKIDTPANDVIWAGGNNTLQLNATGGTVPYFWESSTPWLVSVSSNGLLSPVDFSVSTISGASQMATVVVTDTDGNSDKINIIVNKAFVTSPVPAITINQSTKLNTFIAGSIQSHSISGTGSVSFDEATATLTGELAGDVVITIVDSLGNIASTQSIAVNTLPLVIMEPSARDLWLGNNSADSVSLVARDGQGPYQWSSDTPGIATVDASGLVNAVAEGTAVIRVNDSLGNSNAITLNVKKFSIEASTTTISEYDSLQLSAQGEGLINWSIGGDAIATINQLGLVETSGAGFITVTANDDLFNTASIDIVVEALPPLSISGIVNTLWIGSSDKAQLTPSGGKMPYSWSSDTPSVATVDDTGVVSAIAPGNAIIRLTDAVSNTVTYSLTVDAISVTSPGTTLVAYNSMQLSANGFGVLSWSASGGGATISQTGVLSVTAAGTVVVSVTDEMFNRASISINVTALPELLISPPATTSLWLGNGNSVDLDAYGGKLPYTWSTSHSSVISVNNEGIVTAVGVGTGNVNVTDAVGNTKTLSINVSKLTVVAPMTSVQSYDELQLSANGFGALTWSSSGASALISQNGLLTTSASGVVTVTVSDDLNNSASIDITVSPLAPLMLSNLGTSELWLGNGKSTQLSATGGKPNYTWSSDTPDIASIDENGFVTALATGSAQLRVTDAVGFSATIAVSVNQITISASVTNFQQYGQLQLSAVGSGTLSWSVLGPGASVTQQGLLTSIESGELLVTVTDMQSNSASLIITVTPVSALTISGMTTTQLWIGNGSRLNLSSIGGIAPYTWTSTNTGVATVSSEGVVVATGIGSANIVLTDNVGTSTQVSINVDQVSLTVPTNTIEVADQLQFMASGYGTLTLAVSNGSASITQGGLLTANSSGSVIVTVTDELNNSASQTISINALPSLTIQSPITTQLWLGNGNTVDLIPDGGKAPYTWAVSTASAGVISVDVNGRVTALAVGTGTVILSDALGSVDTINISVDQTSLSADSYTIREGGSIQLTPHGSGSYSWNINGTGQATIDDVSYTLTAQSPGNVTVTLTDGVGNNVSINVTIEAIPDLLISGSVTTELWLGNANSAQLSANGGFGNYTWVVSSGVGVVSVDSNGLVLAQSVGTAVVTVSDESGRSDDIQLSVDRVSIEGSSSVTLTAGNTVQFSGNGFGTLDWAVDRSDLASIDANGFLTTFASGTVQVTVTDENNNTSSPVTVQINAPTGGGGGMGGH